MPAPTKIYVACSGISGKGGGASTKMGGHKKVHRVWKRNVHVSSCLIDKNEVTRQSLLGQTSVIHHIFL